MELTIHPEPSTSNISGNHTPDCFASGETYSVDLTSGSKYYWTIPGSATLTSDTTGIEQNSVTIDFTSISGFLSVYEINQYGCTGEEITVLIELQGCELAADFVVDDNNICIEETVTFTNNSGGTGTGTLYSWNFGDGAVPSTSNGIGPHDVFYSTSGNKTISLTITQGLSDTETKTDFVTVNPKPTATIDPAERCGAGEVTLTAFTTDGDMIDFSLNNGVSIDYTDAAAPYQFLTAIPENSTTEIWVRAGNSATGCAGEWINSANAYSYPIPVTGDIVPDNPNGDGNYIDIVCAGTDNVGYSINEIAGSTFNWAVTALGLTVEDSPQIIVDWNIAGGEYIISVVEISEHGCEGVMSEETVLVPEPIADLGGDKYVCDGESAIFSTETAFDRYLWHNGATSDNISVNEEGLVSLIAWDQYDCITRDSAYLYINELPVVDLGNDTIICGTYSYELDAGDFMSYIWSTGETNNPIDITAGEQTISVTVTDDNGCIGGDSVNISICDPASLFEEMTNAFTPNNDGVHDTWIINNIYLFPEAKIEVFDRWGRRVFRKDGRYENDWDGTSKGKELPMDSYYYIIDLNIGGEPLKGTVTIIR